MRQRNSACRRTAAIVLGACLAAAPAGSAGAREPVSVESLRIRLAEVGARLDELYADADAAILAYEEQRELLEEAADAYEEAREQADVAADLHGEARSGGVRYAVLAYQGVDLGPAQAWADGGALQEVLARDGYLRLLDGRKLDRLDRANAAGLVGETLRRRARATREARGAAALDAAEARNTALDAVDAQESELRSLLEEQTGLDTALAAAREGDAEPGAEHERALLRARSAVGNADHGAPWDSAEPSGTDPGDDSGDGSEDAAGPSDAACTGGPFDRHPNGGIPASALCPLPQPGEALRADAAAAFIELDGAYRERFGRPMCVTDSYRPFDEQVRLFREKPPGTAARPGTSAHGLGLAVDLCGGVHEHGSREHAWMLDTAPSYGWTNPDWARNGFEPWHWEYLDARSSR
ncbi:M15 family metallopeptidase [Actinorugispora endophytica]|uniref:D-alanyl-D-alanine carboxypeptidase-like protein n=1 Tax=Actinorugispora endophytica TaxID=1605990 RepID=A0A4R6UYH4_9ACTN|nr:M15 family metallopeptidase [Actinorugispora endophytica]TDQ52413.1 D-alanyl-D-alanine carboxypeptidase-like protein [Actinorugispora endophytica]